MSQQQQSENVITANRLVSIGLLILLSILSSLVFVSCSSGQDIALPQIFPEYKRPVGNPNARSIDLYTLGENALAEANYNFAAILFRQADAFDPMNVTIKERLLDTYLIMADADTTLYTEMIALGNHYIDNELITPEIYRSIAHAHINSNRIEKGLSLLRKALELDQDSFHYYDYFIYVARLQNRFDFIYLEKALKDSWHHPQLVNAIAQVYEHTSPLRSKEILEKAYTLDREDEQTLSNLLEFYKRFRDWKSFNQVIEKRIDENKFIPKEYKDFYLTRLFFIDDFPSIGKVYEYFQQETDYLTVRILFYASFKNEDYQRVIEMSKKLLDLTEVMDDEKELILIYLGKAHYYSDQYKEAVSTLSKLDEPLLLYGTFQLIQEKRPEFDIAAFIKDARREGLREVTAALLFVVHYLDIGDQDNAEIYIAELLASEADDDGIWKSVARTLLQNDYPQEASLALAKIDDPEFDPDGFLALYYTYNDQDSLATVYVEKILATEPHPSSDAFRIAATVYTHNDMSMEVIDVMEKALQYYPEDPEILNWLGYTLIVNTERYDEAEVYLLKAIELSPESQHIQDSVAWLYFKLKEYDKALGYMQEIIDSGVDSSVVSYHIGMIYRKLDDYQQAEDYFLWAIELDTDNEYVVKSINELILMGVYNE